MLQPWSLTDVRTLQLFNSPQAASHESPASSSANLPSPHTAAHAGGLLHSTDPFSHGALPVITPDHEGFPGMPSHGGDWGMFANLNDDLFNYEDLLRYTLPQDPLDGAQPVGMDGMGFPGVNGMSALPPPGLDVLGRTWSDVGAGGGAGASPGNW